MQTNIKIRYFEISLPRKYFCSRYVQKAEFFANCTQNTFLKTGLFEILIINQIVIKFEPIIRKNFRKYF
jgi:hypothetical protein